MLVLTPTAVEVVNKLTAAVGASEGAGLRLSSDAGLDEGALRADLTAGPAGHDRVLNETGVRIFLELFAATYLSDKVLDVKIDEHGQVHFMLSTQIHDGDGIQA